MEYFNFEIGKFELLCAVSNKMMSHQLLSNPKEKKIQAKRSSQIVPTVLVDNRNVLEG